MTKLANIAALILLLLLCAFATVAQQDSDARLAAQQLSFWLEIKKGLTGPESDKYWEAMKDASVPGPMTRSHTLRGTVLSSNPTDHPTELTLAMSDDHTPEVKLKLHGNGKSEGLKRPVPPGTIVEFGGVAKQFTREPFMLTFDVYLTFDPDIGLWIFRNDHSKEQQK